MDFTGKRAEFFEYLQLLRQERIITAKAFNEQVRELKAKQQKIDDAVEKRRVIAERKREAKKAEKARQRAEATAKRREERKLERSLTSVRAGVIADTRISSEEDAIRFWKRVRGQTVRLMRVNNGEVISDQVETISNKYKEFRQMLITLVVNQIGSEYEIDEDFIGGRLLAMRPSNIKAKRIAQAFADGIRHCVFTPIFNKLTELAVDLESESSKKRMGQRMKCLQKMFVEYENKGRNVPEADMEKVAKAAGLKITIFDVLGNVMAVYNENGKVGSLRMTNTRHNHLEDGLVVDSDPKDVSEEQLLKEWNDCKNNNVFYMIEGDIKEKLPTAIRTLNGAYRLYDENRDIFRAFDDEIGIANYRINATKNPELNSFLKTGRIVNGWSCDLQDRVYAKVKKYSHSVPTDTVVDNGYVMEDVYNEGEEWLHEIKKELPVKCADMPKAYAQFKRCSEYAGFLGHIHQFRTGEFSLDFVKQHLGYYKFQITKQPNDLLRRLGFYAGNSYILFSPELLYYCSLGMEVKVFQGAWGSRFDFEFTEEMLKKRRYCKWAGRLGMEREDKVFTISAKKEFAENLLVDYHGFYWKSDELLTIRQPVKAVWTNHHILGGITAYVRIQMVQAMLQFQPDMLVRVVLDGIYYKGAKPKSLDWFVEKPVSKQVDNYSQTWFSPDDDTEYNFPPMSRVIRNSLLSGQGGSGKTYSIFKDEGFNNVLFVSPSHILGQDVREKYGAYYTTIHKLIGIECRPYHEENRIPSVIFVDEITQVPAEWIEKVFEMYPQSLVILAGDVDSQGRWYQCRSGDGDNWNTIFTPRPELVDVIEYNVDMRSRDDKLKELKLAIREEMRRVFDEGETAVHLMKAWAMKNLPLSNGVEFQKGDTCIASTHAINKKLLDAGIVSGYYKKGGFVSDVEQSGYEKRGSFTIHSYQGKTIETGNVWIFLNDMFEYAQLYTAVSRVVNYEQLRFVRK